MKKTAIIFTLLFAISIPGRTQSPASWDSYKLNVLSFYDNGGGSRDLDQQDLVYNFTSELGTTEFLIVSASNGNSNTTNKPTLVYDGGWGDITVYGGNDDKSVEVWMRQVTSSNIADPGDVDARGAYADFAILVYPGLLKAGQVSGKILGGVKPNITNLGTAPWLVVATTDNGNNHGVPGTTLADAEFYSKKDDRVFVYLTGEKTFSDNTSFNVRGSICSIELIEEGAAAVDLDEDQLGHDLGVYPNPTSDGLIKLELKSAVANIAMVNIIGMDGRIAYADDWVLTEGNNRMNLELDRKLKSGSYIVHLVSDKQSLTTKLILL